jgi:predicted Zn-dependent peptidase
MFKRRFFPSWFLLFCFPGFGSTAEFPQGESPVIEVRQIRCRQCPQLVKEPDVNFGRVVIANHHSLILAVTRRPSTTVEYQIVGAGPACSSDPLTAALAAEIVRRSLEKSDLSDFGVSTSVSAHWPDPDVTLVASGPSDGANRWFRKLFSIVSSPRITETDYNTLRSATIDELARAFDQPAQYGSFVASATFMGVRLDELIEAVHRRGSSYPFQAILEWHHRHYTESSLRIGLVGPQEKALLAEAKRMAGFLDETPSCPSALQASKKYSSYTFVPDDSSMASIYVVGSAPHATERERVLLYVANNLLGAGPESRLRATIRERQGLSYDVGSRVGWSSIGTPWIISASSAASNFQQLVEGLRREVSRLAREGPSAQELLWAKEGIMNEAAMSTENPAATLSTLLTGFPRGKALDAILQTISPSDVGSLVSQSFLSNRSRVVVVGPKGYSDLTTGLEPCVTETRPAQR